MKLVAGEENLYQFCTQLETSMFSSLVDIVDELILFSLEKKKHINA